MTATREDIERKANVIGSYINENGDLVALVTKKLPEERLADEDIVDDVVDVDGEQRETGVEEAGIPHMQTVNQERKRPVPGGMSIGDDEGGAGTMGSPLLETEDGWTVTLTNRHVVQEGDDVYQPALLDGGSESEDDQIGHVIEHSTFDHRGENECDSALVAVNTGVGDRHIRGIGPLAGFREAEYGLHTKSGRTTGVTRGRLRGRDARVRVAYGDQTLLFTGLDVYGAMSRAGDSGSLIGVIEDGKFYGTSLLFAGSDRITLGIPMSTVMDVHGELRPYGCAPDPDVTSAVTGEGVPWWHAHLTALASGVVERLQREWNRLAH